MARITYIISFIALITNNFSIHKIYDDKIFYNFVSYENELYISDYNFHNHSYLYNDLPVILEESADVTYYDWSRKASLVAKVGDKVKNNINNFK